MTNLDKNYWLNRYLNNQVGWDIGTISRPLKSYFNQITNKEITILIPGCGNGYEAEYLFNKGFLNTFAIDLVEPPILNLKTRCKEFPEGQAIVGNLFDWEFETKFDLVIEQTIFCAIEPRLRRRYLNRIKDLLKVNGKYVGVLFDRTFNVGPPFGGSRYEYEKLFHSVFKKFSVEKCYNSIEDRQGSEFFIRCRK